MRPLNIADWPPAERRALNVDLIAKRLLLHQAGQGTNWRKWAIAEIDRLAKDYRQPVKDRLNVLMAAR